MKRLLLVSLLALVSLPALAQSHLTVWAYAFDTDISLGWLQPRPPRTCGVWVAVWVVNPTDALRLTIYYTDAGRELSRSMLVEVQRPGVAGWTNWQFALGDHPVEIRSIQVQALESRESRTVGLGVN